MPQCHLSGKIEIHKSSEMGCEGIRCLSVLRFRIAVCAAVPGQSISFGVIEWVCLADRAIELWRLIQDEPFKLRQHES